MNNGQNTVNYPVGGKYFDEYKESKRKGLGIYISHTAAKYVGEFKDDMKVE